MSDSESSNASTLRNEDESSSDAETHVYDSDHEDDGDSDRDNSDNDIGDSDSAETHVYDSNHDDAEDSDRENARDSDHDPGDSDNNYAGDTDRDEPLDSDRDVFASDGSDTETAMSVSEAETRVSETDDGSRVNSDDEEEVIVISDNDNDDDNDDDSQLSGATRFSLRRRRARNNNNNDRAGGAPQLDGDESSSASTASALTTDDDDDRDDDASSVNEQLLSQLRRHFTPLNDGGSADAASGGESSSSAGSSRLTAASEASAASTAAAAVALAQESPSRKRKREDDADDATPNKIQINGEEDDDDDGKVCTICFESWSNSGEHRIASLKCGHLFGKSCITKWLSGSGSKCPQCNEPAKSKDVRVIFCKKLVAIDTSERDRALEQLEREKTRRVEAEKTISDLRVSLELLRSEKDGLRRALEDAVLRGGAVGGSNVSSIGVTGAGNAPSSGTYSLWRHQTVGDGGCRLVEFARRAECLVVSRQQNNPLFPGFGVQLIQSDFSRQKFVALHSKTIKCLSINKDSSQLLSVGLDKQIKLTSLSSGNPVAAYSSSRALWSSAWDAVDESVFYVGLDSGVVHIYDTRRPQDHANPTENYAGLGPSGASRTPVVALHSVPPAPQHPFKAKGLLVGHLDGKCFFYEETEPSVNVASDVVRWTKSWRPHPLPLEGSLVSLSFDESTRSILASFRPNGKYPRVRHVVAKLGCGGDGALTCLDMKVFEGGASQKLLAKSTLFLRSSSSSPSSSDRRAIVCSGDEESKSVFLWDGITGDRAQTIRVNSCVVDVCHLPARRRGEPDRLALLSDKLLSVYNFG